MIPTGLTAIRSGVPANAHPLLVTGAEEVNPTANDDCSGSTTAVPSPTVPRADVDTTEGLEVLLNNTRPTSQ